MEFYNSQMQLNLTINRAAARVLHELKIGKQSLLAREQERGGGVV